MLGFILVGVFVGAPAPGRASGYEVFEGTVPYPGGEPASQIGQLTGCPGGPPVEPASYVVIDFGEQSKFRFFRLSGPPYIVNEPDPTGSLTALIADHDLDLYLFDEHCRAVQEHANNNNSDVTTKTMRRARYALINYYSGIHLDLPYKLEASTSSAALTPGPT